MTDTLRPPAHSSMGPREPGLPGPLPAPDQQEQNKLTPTQAQTIIAAAILRQLHAVITTGRAWDPATATHGTRRQGKALAA